MTSMPSMLCMPSTQGRCSSAAPALLVSSAMLPAVAGAPRVHLTRQWRAPSAPVCPRHTIHPNPPPAAGSHWFILLLLVHTNSYF